MASKFELVEALTRDGLVHQGIVSLPSQKATAGKPPSKAILWVHGLTGRFFGDVKLMNLFAEECAKEGLAFAAFNNRGHDIIANIHKLKPGSLEYDHVTIGAGRESFPESVFDIDGSISYLVNQGFTQVVLVGHSTGANKVCYYAGNAPDPRVAGVVLAGPMSDRLSERTDKKNYDGNLKMLKELIVKGKGDALLTTTHWFPATANRIWSLLAPNTKEDVFNYGDKKDVLAVFHNIVVPVLVTLSGNDESADRQIETIREVFDTHTGSKNYRSVIIPDTTHGYEGKEKLFVSTVVDWASKI